MSAAELLRSRLRWDSDPRRRGKVGEESEMYKLMNKNVVHKIKLETKLRPKTQSCDNFASIFKQAPPG